MKRKSIKIMSANSLKTICLGLLAGIFVISLPFKTSASEKIIKYKVETNEVQSVVTEVDSVSTQSLEVIQRESIFGGNRPLDNSHFTWGADFGASVDLTAHDMSTFDIDIIMGYKNKYIKTVGIGAGIHRTVQGGDNFIPIYALLRTSFTSRPSLLFMNARFGYSFNTVEKSPTFGDYNAALGCGINLSQSSKAKSYIIVGVAYRYFNKTHRDYITRLDSPYIWIAQLQFGVNF